MYVQLKAKNSNRKNSTQLSIFIFFCHNYEVTNCEWWKKNLYKVINNHFTIYYIIVVTKFLVKIVVTNYFTIFLYVINFYCFSFEPSLVSIFFFFLEWSSINFLLTNNYWFAIYKIRRGFNIFPKKRNYVTVMDNITRRGINVGYAQTMTWTAEIASRWISF